MSLLPSRPQVSDSATVGAATSSLVGHKPSSANGRSSQHSLLEDFHCAAKIITGIEVMHMIRKGQ